MITFQDKWVGLKGGEARSSAKDGSKRETKYMNIKYLSQISMLCDHSTMT